MYAVIKTGGKQYKVASGDVLKIEKIAGEAGKEVVFNEVLAIDETVGTPLVARRQNYRRKNGHRQSITLVKITEICGK